MKPTYVVEQIPDEDQWRVFRVNEHGIYHRVTVYKSKIHAEMSAAQLERLSLYESE